MPASLYRNGNVPSLCQFLMHLWLRSRRVQTDCQKLARPAFGTSPVEAVV